MDAQTVRQKLLAAAASGKANRLRPADLTLEELGAMADFCRVAPGVGFSPPQRDYMRGGYLCVPSADEIDAANAAAPANHRIGYRGTLDGEAAMPVDQFTCARPNEVFGFAWLLLYGARFDFLGEDAFPQPEPMT
jgi:hypothetical protein